MQREKIVLENGKTETLNIFRVDKTRWLVCFTINNGKKEYTRELYNPFNAPHKHAGLYWFTYKRYKIFVEEEKQC